MSALSRAGGQSGIADASLTARGERSAITALYAAKIEATRRGLPAQERDAAIRALIEERRAFMRAVTERKQIIVRAARERRVRKQQGSRQVARPGTSNDARPR